MSQAIVNKVANSLLVNFDLEDYIPIGTRTFLDLSQWLEGGLLLREKPFRTLLKGHNWSQYEQNHVALGCSSDAVLPAWASLLVASYLQPFVKTLVSGSLEDLERHLFSKTILEMDLSSFKDKPIMIKGCSEHTIPQDAYIQLILRLQGVAKSMFYGEACSSVPLWKAKK